MEGFMTIEANKRIARQFFEATNTGDGAAMVDRLLAAGFQLNGAPFDPNEWKDLFTWAQSEVPDWHFTIEDMLAEGDQVAVRLSVSGTPRTHWRRYRTNGRSFISKGFCFFRIVDGMIAEVWDQFSELWELQQLGALPTPEQAEAGQQA
jgi:predicted ester cyclase